MRQSLSRLKALYTGEGGPVAGCRGEYHVDGGGQLTGGAQRCDF